MIFQSIPLCRTVRIKPIASYPDSEKYRLLKCYAKNYPHYLPVFFSDASHDDRQLLALLFSFIYFRSIPATYYSYELLYDAIESGEVSLRDLPREVLTHELCRAAISMYSADAAFVPEELWDFELLSALKRFPDILLRYAPDHFLSEDLLCELRIGFSYLIELPIHLLTPALVEIASGNGCHEKAGIGQNVCVARLILFVAWSRKVSKCRRFQKLLNRNYLSEEIRAAFVDLSRNWTRDESVRVAALCGLHDLALVMNPSAEALLDALLH